MKNKKELTESKKVNMNYLTSEVQEGINNHRHYWPYIVASLLFFVALGVLCGLPFLHILDVDKRYVYSFTFLDLLIGRTSTYNYYDSPEIASNMMRFNLLYLATLLFLVIGTVLLLCIRKGNKLVTWLSFIFLFIGFGFTIMCLSEMFFGNSFSNDAAGIYYTRKTRLKVFQLGSSVFGPMGLGAMIGIPVLFVYSFSPFICNAISEKIAIKEFKTSVKVGKKLLNY